MANQILVGLTRFKIIPDEVITSMKRHTHKHTQTHTNTHTQHTQPCNHYKIGPVIIYAVVVVLLGC
jgi:hypothetical protein